MATTPLLGLDVYLALAAVGWADGELTREAADAILRTAAEEGLEIEQLSEIEEAVKTRTDVEVVDRMGMSKSDRLYLYAVASWIAALDGDVSQQEEQALVRLGTALSIPETPRKHADAIMREIAGEDSRPERFDLRALRHTLDERLEAARRARLAHRSQAKQDTDLRSGKCPLCDATDVVQRATESSRAAARSTFGVGPWRVYVCRPCGYVQTFLVASQELDAESSQAPWSKVAASR